MINHFLLKMFAPEDSLFLFENIKFSEDEKEEFRKINHYVAEQSALKFNNKQVELETFVEKFPESNEHFEKRLALQIIIDYYYYTKINWKEIVKRRRTILKYLGAINLGDRDLYNTLHDEFSILNSVYRQCLTSKPIGQIFL